MPWLWAVAGVARAQDRGAARPDWCVAAWRRTRLARRPHRRPGTGALSPRRGAQREKIAERSVVLSSSRRLSWPRLFEVFCMICTAASASPASSASAIAP